jgi:hypothetical protein
MKYTNISRYISAIVIVTRIHCVNPLSSNLFRTTQKQVENRNYENKLDNPNNEVVVTVAVINHCNGYLINIIAIIIHLRNFITSIFKQPSFLVTKS